MKSYKVIRSFWIGELNKEVKADSEVTINETMSSITIGMQNYEIRSIKAAIKAGWLVPVDGVLPTLDGPIGETYDEAAERKRKERFVEIAKKNNPDQLVKDEREIVNFGGCIKDTNAESFAKALDLDVSKQKFKTEIIEEDARVIKTNIMGEDKEVQQIKTALGQDKEEKKDPKNYKIFTDHYDSETVHIGKYTEFNRENTIKNWSTLHWTKKAEVIDKADKNFLEKLKNIEFSEKIVNRINKKIQTL